MTQRTFLERLDAHNNEADVREQLAEGNYNSSHAALAHEWLRRREFARLTEASAKLDAREEEALSISKRAAVASEEALSIAKEANRIARDSAKSARANARWAMYAAIIAAIVAAIATKDQILALIFGSP